MRAPAGLRAGVVPLTAFESEQFQRAHQLNEMLARIAERMMIVIAPTQAEFILARFLDLRRAIATLPKLAFTSEHYVTGEIASNEANQALD